MESLCRVSYGGINFIMVISSILERKLLAQDSNLESPGPKPSGLPVTLASIITVAVNRIGGKELGPNLVWLSSMRWGVMNLVKLDPTSEPDPGAGLQQDHTRIHLFA